MSVSIGKTAAVLTANSNEFTTAYRQAEAGLDEFVKSIAHVNQALEELQHEKAAAEGHGEGFLKSMVEFEALREGVALAREFTVEIVKGSFESIDALAKMSEKTGIATDALSRLQYAAKLSDINAEQLTDSIIKMGKNLYEAANGGAPEAQKALAELGLDAKELAALSPDEQFLRIAQALSEVGDSGKKSSAAMEIFGKSGAQLKPLLNQGAEGIAKLFEESDKIGNTVSAIDAKKVEQANDALTTAKTMVQAIGNAVAIDLAPYITAMSHEFVEWGTAGGGAGKAVVGGLEWVLKVAGEVADYGNLIIAGWYALRAAAAAQFAGVVGSIDLAGGALVKLLNLIPGVHLEWTDQFHQLAEGLREEAEKQLDSATQAYDRFADGSASKAVNRFLEDARRNADAAADAAAGAGEAMEDIGDSAEKADKKVTQTLDKLREQVRTFGMTEAQKEVDALKAAGASEGELQEAEGPQKRLDALQEEKKAHEDAAKAAEDYYKKTQTPAEKYADELDRINALVEEGYLDTETARRAADQAAAELKKTEKTTKESKIDSAGLLQSGSQAAATLLATFANQSRGGTEEVAKKQLDVQMDLLGITRTSATNIGTLADAFKNIGRV